ncbi:MULTISPECIES: hypothetical protein [Nostoc]|uniref:Uncharacterized protein n=1 Tax=Nostoc paludosum FACHB-159 TaxID=2692908 RepID=A0ABR8K7G9_9NOSO|nr:MULTISPECIES: hypothetical protein [Nostoc]MBD2683382.1 hypothetical protein [Nostoc sp. FACHB-857]MBD2734062.1 hypothetical protein [Nostoc paludosum FACHB-159]
MGRWVWGVSETGGYKPRLHTQNPPPWVQNLNFPLVRAGGHWACRTADFVCVAANSIRFPQVNSGYPRNNSDFPQNNSDFPRNISGFPRNISGFPQNNSGYPQN